MAPDNERAKLLASDEQGNLVHWIAVQRKVRPAALAGRARAAHQRFC